MMVNRKGKITIIGLLFLVVIIYGVFAAVKYIGSNFTETEIAKEIKDTLGFLRGRDFSPERATEEIEKILTDHDVIFEEKRGGIIDVALDQRGRRIEYYVKYILTVDYLLFKKEKTVELEEDLRSYD